jgi:hypothetical protein
LQLGVVAVSDVCKNHALDSLPAKHANSAKFAALFRAFGVSGGPFTTLACGRMNFAEVSVYRPSPAPPASGCARRLLR